MSLKKLKKKNNSYREFKKEADGIIPLSDKELDLILDEAMIINFIPNYISWFIDFYNLKTKEKNNKEFSITPDNLKYTSYLLQEHSFKNEISWIKSMYKFIFSFSKNNTEEQIKELLRINKNARLQRSSSLTYDVWYSIIKSTLHNYTKDIYFKKNKDREDILLIRQLDKIILLIAMVFSIKAIINNDRLLHLKEYIPNSKIKILKSHITKGANIFKNTLYHISGDILETEIIMQEINNKIEIISKGSENGRVIV